MDTTQLLKGVLDAAVLAVVSHEDGYGYDVVRRLRSAGLDNVGDASVYGTLRRLYTAGSLSTYVVASDGGPNRKYYSITSQGHHALAEQRITWAAFTQSLSALLNNAASQDAAGAPPSGAVSNGAALGNTALGNAALGDGTPHGAQRLDEYADPVPQPPASTIPAASEAARHSLTGADHDA
ncbi:PadR family transcriptional regulator [Lysinibacter cavernae]|uniref:PadR family transcriptional regulator PadR n=1 Tax=Lysinibacter cavernae TaxID=1640652 RepID=A0A7X5R319_9MICO|nr:PadR family transcriptional regulator PadR [Lysinibacter cavernae]